MPINKKIQDFFGVTGDFAGSDTEAVGLIVKLTERGLTDGDLTHYIKPSTGAMIFRYWFRTRKDGYESAWHGSMAGAICDCACQFIDDIREAEA